MKRSVTHVVVRAGDPDPTARLVPLQLVAGGADPGDALSLTCSAEQFEQLESVQGYAYLPVDERPAPDSEWDVGVEDVVMMPSYQGADLGVYTAEIDPNVGVTYDRVPKGEVEIRRLERRRVVRRPRARHPCTHSSSRTLAITHDRRRARPPLVAPRGVGPDRIGRDPRDERDRPGA